MVINPGTGVVGWDCLKSISYTPTRQIGGNHKGLPLHTLDYCIDFFVVILEIEAFPLNDPSAEIRFLEEIGFLGYLIDKSD
ncbi:MAG: hypothetical protein DRR19_01950 [Candidatus Parabeggiatoa sp. nov. 1]|nr:MAG: hypothetical protein DRR19_01950 [Gammaproteobacteria bacterium]